MELKWKVLCACLVLFAAGACAGPSAHPIATKKKGGAGATSTDARDGGARTQPGSPDGGRGQVQRATPVAEQSQIVGMIIGPGTKDPPANLNLYGTDLGLTYVHEGQVVILFGDTWMTPMFPCEEPDPTNDDTMATMPLAYAGGIPPLTFVTQSNSPQDPARIHLMRGTNSLGLGSAKVAMAGFSDGEQEYAIFARFEPTLCGGGSVPGSGVCPTAEGYVCSTDVGHCTPPYGSVDYQCDLNAADGVGCFPGQLCTAPDSAFCIDPQSSEHDSTIAGEIWSLAQDNEIGLRRPGQAVYDSVLVWPSNRFANLTARAVGAFTGKREGNDYATGNGALLVWGRPGFVGEDGRQAQLYLMMHALPFAHDAAGGLQFQPQYFAGVDAATHEPTWSPVQTQAKPLALDGIEDGDPHESEQIVNQMSVSWLGAPIDKWVMLYGGDISDLLLYDKDVTRAKGVSGAIMIRFADYPWGPFSPAVPLLSPGDPTRAGDPTGPGGFVFSPDCKDQPPLRCTPPIPQSMNSPLAGCIGPQMAPYPGHLYSAAIIDAYTAPNRADGLDIFWNVSTWNPYSVVLVKTTIRNGRSIGPIPTKP